MHSFEDNVSLLFKDKFPDGPKTHPMHQYINQFSFSITPSGGPEGNETEMSSAGDPSHSTFKDITTQLTTMSEPRKNMLNCEELFSIYLRECSTVVNERYYSTLIQFLIMFRDCLNMYGW